MPSWTLSAIHTAAWTFTKAINECNLFLLVMVILGFRQFYAVPIQTYFFFKKKTQLALNNTRGKKPGYI